MGRRSRATPAGPPADRLVGIRRSQLVGGFGPGAVVDTLPEQRPQKGVSGLVAGLAEWDRAAAANRAGLQHGQVVVEPRLARDLGVRGLRAPPIISDEDAEHPRADDILPIVHFPRWMFCPRCERLDRFDAFPEDHPMHPVRVCRRRGCDGIQATPVRFVIACEAGHLDDFDWKTWSGCTCQGPGNLRLRARGAGLAGLRVECDQCDNGRSIEAAFKPGELMDAEIYCSGRHLWSTRLGPDLGCRARLHLLQRGSSSIYFSDIRSVISIPPFTDGLAEMLGATHMGMLTHMMEQATSPQDFRSRVQIWMQMVPPNSLPRPADVIEARILQWFVALQRQTPEDVPDRWEEYSRLRDGLHEENREQEFHVRPAGDLPRETTPLFEGLVAAPKLREVRAITGFSRVNGVRPLFRAGRVAGGFVDIADEVGREWLPAVEINGEGLFLLLDEDALTRWGASAPVDTRMRHLRSRIAPLLREGETLDRVTPRMVLLHSLAHALMRRLTLSCGYSSASLKERIYSCDTPPHCMAGILISTGSPDSEGTLGGLVRQSEPSRFVQILRELLDDMEWCSSDPVCIDGAISLSTPENGAACHACLLAPETSCEHHNLALDRAFLVGTPELPEMGFLDPIRTWLRAPGGS